jgi:VanZ family protein
MASASLSLTSDSGPEQALPLHNLTQSSSRIWTALRCLIPVLLFAGILAVGSSRVFGTDHTSAPLHRIVQYFFGSAINHSWSHIHHLIRKTGHFFVYGTFSLLAFRAAWEIFRRSSISSLRLQQVSHILAIAATVFAASADEIHQSFLPNRTGCLADVLLDTTGAAVMQLGTWNNPR